MTDNRRAEVDQATENIDFDSTSYQVEFQTSLGKITLDLWNTSYRDGSLSSPGPK